VASYADLQREVEHLAGALSEAREQQTATSEILHVISSSPTNVQPVLDAVAENAARLCGATDALIHRLEGEGMRRVAHRGTMTSAVGSDVLPVTRDTPSGRAICEQRTIHIDDILEEFARGEYLEARGLQQATGFRTILSIPLVRENAVIGVIVIRRVEVRPFTEKQMQLVKTFADQAVIAIENVRLFKELEEKNRALTEAHAQVTETLEQQTATSEILRVISSAHTDAQPVFDTIVQSAVRLCNAANAAVFRTDGRTVYEPANYGSSPEALATTRARYPRPLDMETTPGIAILTRSIVQISDVEDPSAIEFVRQSGRLLGFRSVVTVPMLREGEAVGAIIVARREPGRFSDAEVEVLKTFADQAVIAIENVRLFTELQEKNRALTAAHAQVTEALEQQTATSEILRVISSSPTDVEPVFQTILSSTNRLCEASFSVLWLWDGEALIPAAHANVSPNLAEHLRTSRARPRRGGSPVALTALEQTVIHVPDVLDDPRFSPADVPSYQFEGARSILSVPMLREGSLVGVINTWRREPRAFTDKQVALLKTFADQAVIAIENARLFKELEVRNRDLTAALDRQTATGDVLRIIAQSPTELQPVLEVIAMSALRLCAASDVVIERLEGERFYNAAHAGTQMKGLVGPAASPHPPVPRGTRDSRSEADHHRRHATGSGKRVPRHARAAQTQHRPQLRGDPVAERGEAPGQSGGPARRGAPFHRFGGYPARDLRGPGGHRHRERAAVHRAAGKESRVDPGAWAGYGGSGAADGDQRDTPRHLKLADRRADGVRHHRTERRPALPRARCGGLSDRRPDGAPPGKLRQLARGTRRYRFAVPQTGGDGFHARHGDPDAVGRPCARYRGAISGRARAAGRTSARLP